MKTLETRETIMQNDIVKILEKAGVRNAKRHPFTTNYLPRVLQQGERVMAAVFGRRKESEGFFGFVEGMLVATDKRVIFIDHRPGYTTMDEVSYDVVSGVNISSTVFYASVTLFTKIANYKLAFAEHAAAEQFAQYIETRVIEHEQNEFPATRPPYQPPLSGEAKAFLNAHEIGVLSSVERTGSLSGAAVYYALVDDCVYFVTKASSRKANNMMGNQHVAFTVFDEAKLQTAQVQGIVEPSDDKEKNMMVLAVIGRPRTYEDGSHRVPLMRMSGNDYVTYKIIPTKCTFADYRHN